MTKLVSMNPATGLVLETFQECEQNVIEAIIDQSHEQFFEWRSLKLTDRIKKIASLSERLKLHAEEYAQTITVEMGKLYKESIAEVKKCALLCDFYCQKAESLLADQVVETEYKKSYVTYQPLGVILGIMPWNFPFWQVFRYAIPALLVGNTILLKHASNVPQCGILLERLFHEAGIKGFNNLLISSKGIAPVIHHPKVKAISLTGSGEAGRQVAELAGSCLKKTVLELGGSDPYLILKDADLVKTVDKCVQGRLLNMGQSCISAKRFIIETAIYDEFIALFKEKLMKYVPGDPFEEATNIAPLATEAIRSQLHEQVLNSIKKGAQCILGGEPYDRAGFYYQLTILTELKSGMPAYDEELFGPVASMIRARDEKEAIQIANETVYGLGSAVFSRDIERAEKIAKYEIQAGSCFVNDAVKSDPRLPFGGINQSGYGRELSHYGLLEFTNIKTVCIGVF